MKPLTVFGVIVGTIAIIFGGAQASDPPISQTSVKKTAGASGKPAKPENCRAAKERDRTLAILRLLDRPVERIDFDQLPLEQVFTWFKEQGLDNFMIKWKVLVLTGVVTRETPISLSLEEMTLGEVLDMVMEQASWAAAIPDDEITYHIFNGILRISTRGDFARNIYTRTYYVEDLLYPVAVNELLPYLIVGQQFAYVSEVEPQAASGAVASRPIIDVIDSGTIFGPGDPGYGRPDFKALRAERLKDLTELLKRVRPRTWRENGGKGTIQAFGDKLIISQTLDGNRHANGDRIGV